MAVDRNAGIKLHKSGKSNVEIAKRLAMNRSTEWKHEEKAATKLPRRSCRTFATAAGLSNDY